MNLFVYLPAGPTVWSRNAREYETTSGHGFFVEKNATFVWPKNSDPNTINPESFSKLKMKFNINKAWIVDRIKGTKDHGFISGHINKSGYNYLVGKTPLGSHPTFPDISNIYSWPKGSRTHKVFTVGPNRFGEASNTNIILSEWVGLVAAVWCYVGVNVTALGIPPNKLKVKNFKLEEFVKSLG